MPSDFVSNKFHRTTSIGLHHADVIAVENRKFAKLLISIILFFNFVEYRKQTSSFLRVSCNEKTKSITLKWVFLVKPKMLVSSRKEKT